MKLRLSLYITLFCLLVPVTQCTLIAPLTDALGITQEENGDHLTALLALYVLTQSSSSSSSASSLCDSGSVVNNGLGLGVHSSSLNSCWTCTTSNSTGISWIDDNFKCMTITNFSGTQYNFATSDQPPHLSGYYTSDSACQESFPSGNAANANSITAQSYNIKIPRTPDENSTASSLGIAGVAIDGTVIYNDSAAPGDSLSNELSTMDQGYGHPDNTGTFHYHTEPCKITRLDTSLLGMSLDGYAIYGKYDSDGTLPTLDDNNFHSGSTGIDGNSIGHYHVENSTGTNLLIRSNYHGTKGSF